MDGNSTRGRSSTSSRGSALGATHRDAQTSRTRDSRESSSSSNESQLSTQPLPSSNAHSSLPSHVSSNAHSRQSRGNSTIRQRGAQAVPSDTNTTSDTSVSQPDTRPRVRSTVHRHYHRFECCRNHSSPIATHLHALAPVSAQVDAQTSRSATPAEAPPSYDQVVNGATAAELERPSRSGLVSRHVGRNYQCSGVGCNDIRHFMSNGSGPVASSSVRRGRNADANANNRANDGWTDWFPVEVQSPTGNRQVRNRDRTVTRDYTTARSSDRPYQPSRRSDRDETDSNNRSRRLYTYSEYLAARHNPPLRPPYREHSRSRRNSRDRNASDDSRTRAPHNRRRSPPPPRPPVRCGSQGRNSTANRLWNIASGLENLADRLEDLTNPRGRRRSPRPSPRPSNRASSATSASSATGSATSTSTDWSAPPGLHTISSPATAASGASRDSDYQQAVLAQVRNQPPFNISPAALNRLTYGAIIDASRLRIRRLLLTELVAIREQNPDDDAEESWALLIARAIATGSFDEEAHVIDAWLHAFREPARDSFREYFSLPIEELRVEMLNTRPRP